MNQDQEEFRIFLEAYVVSMRAEHKRFMRQMRDRFIFYVKVVVVIYVLAELAVKAVSK